MLAARVEPKNGLYRNNLCRALSIGVVISGIGPDRRSHRSIIAYRLGEEPRTVIARLGEVLYWLACGIAVLLALAGLWFILFGWADNAVIGLIFLMMVGPVWLAGRACLYVLAGR